MAEKIYKVPKDFGLVFNHGTQVVVVKKLESADDDRLLKKAIKEDYKYSFRDVLVIRDDQITKKHFENNFRGRSVSAVELRTFLPDKEYEILKKAISPSMSYATDSYIKQNVHDKKEKQDGIQE